MIDVKELRLGNWVLHSDNPNPIQINPYGILTASSNPNKFSHILITEEWLVKFGFLPGHDGSLLPRNIGPNQTPYNIQYASIGFDCSDGVGLSPLNIYQIEGGWIVGLDDYNVGIYQHVHQLQNLFFALTGSELEIKENQ